MTLPDAITYLLDDILGPMIDACGDNVKPELVQAYHALGRTRNYELPMEPIEKDRLARQFAAQVEGYTPNAEKVGGLVYRYQAAIYKQATAYCQVQFNGPPMSRHKLKRIATEILEKMPAAAYSLHGIDWEEAADVDVHVG